MKLRRHKGRVLYDVEAHARTTWKQVRRALEKGEPLEASDPATGEDVTADMLLQLLSELAAEGRKPPVAELVRLLKTLPRATIKLSARGQAKLEHLKKLMK